MPTWAEFRSAIEEEAADLVSLAEGLRRQTGSPGFDRFGATLSRALAHARNAREAENALEAGALGLRRRWLDFAGAETHRSYRSPPSEQAVRTPSRSFENFGYERELQPTSLEERCVSFFGPAPAGWRADHILFSSGQAATTAALHLAQALAPANVSRPLTAIHAGAYFETVELLGLLPAFLRVAATGRAALRGRWDGADIILIEPVFYEDSFARVSTADAVRKLGDASGNPPIVIFDDTLIGVAANVAEDLARLDALRPRAVIRLTSGLKLLQAGLELANVGVMSLYTRDRGDEPSQRLRRLRSLLGLGLRFSDVAALEAPWFLDREYTRRHSGAVFENNRALANALASSRQSFETVRHPSIDAAGDVGPFCVLRLRASQRESYDRLAARIHAECIRLASTGFGSETRTGYCSFLSCVKIAWDSRRKRSSRNAWRQARFPQLGQPRSVRWPPPQGPCRAACATRQGLHSAATRVWRSVPPKPGIS